MSGDPSGLAVVVHEIRSPVAALVAIAAAYPDADEARQKRLLELAEAALVSIERLLVEAPTVSLRAERLDAGRLARDAAETAALTSGSGILAQTEDGLVVAGDPERLRQALDNLIDNAIGHSADGDEVRVTAARRGGLITIEVTDEGDGIPAVDLERMFEPGVRLTGDRPGSGLGLAVVRAIARAHGGEVEVESTPGRGATFRLVLPGASGAP
jgi:signal transduction histidine kinase